MKYVKNVTAVITISMSVLLVTQSVTLAEITDIQTGITGTTGNDIIDSTQPVDVNSVLETISDEDLITSATGIDSLTGDDEITSTADITLNSLSKIDAPFVPLKLGGTTSKSSSKGIYGGDGIDLLQNIASIFSTSTSYAEIMEVIMQIDLGSTSFTTTSTADSTGIAGGNEPDTIENEGIIEVTAISDTLVKEAHISAVEVPVDMYGFGNAKNTATSTAVGIAGDELTGTFSSTPGATGIITNNGTLSVFSDANSTTEQGMVELIGSARVDDSTIANAYSAGILGGENNNSIINYQTIDSNATSTADMTSVEIKMKGLMIESAVELFGPEIGTFQTVANSKAVGIAGNTGDDEIINAGTGGAGMIDVYSKAEADSEVYTFSVSPPLPEGGEAVGVLVARSLALPVPPISEIDSDSAPSTYGDASTVAISNSAGILSAEGNDVITNNVALTSQAESEASNLTLSIDINLDKDNFIPSLPGSTVADSSTRAISISRGIDGGTGVDTIENSSNLNASATADADSLGIAATIKGNLEGLSDGASVTDSSSTSIALSKGITGGTDGDSITNTGAITSTATSSDESSSVSVTIAGSKVGIAAGVTLADAVTQATSYSYGIDGEDAGGDESASIATQNDVITNEGQISSTAESTADADAVGVSVAASLQGISVSTAITETDVTSEAYAAGIRSGIGEDTIDNNDLADINTTSIATANSDSVSVAISAAYEGVAMGASIADANTAATAGAVGIDSGASIDTINNNAQITTSSTATVSSQAIAVTAAVPIKGFSAGASFANTETTSESRATGINAGEGNDIIENTATVSTSSAATTTTNTVSIDVAVAGAAIADASSEAKAESTGLSGGAGVDTVTNSGTVVTTATSISDDSSSTFNLIGVASGDMTSISMASATGMSGGVGTAGESTGDTLINESGASITAVADANAYVDDLDINAGGAAFAKAGAQAESGATAIQGGGLGDTIENDGRLSAIANSEVLASSFSFNFAGAQLGSVGTNATGIAVGIDGGDGSNSVSNDPNGQIHTYANLSTTSLNTEIGVLSAQFVRAGVTTEAYSAGILTGQNNDMILNQGSINATANILGQAGGASLGLLSLSLVNAFASADIDGIYAGDGDDVITNEGKILAGRIREGDDYLVKADTEAVSFDLISLLFVSPGTTAHITGIEGGAGHDTLTNSGIIFIGDEAETDECTSSRAMVIGESYGYGGQIAGAELAFAGSSAHIFSVGIDGGSGDDILTNSSEGDITAKARSYADVDCETYLSLGLTDTIARSSSYSEAQATGIYGGNGWDTIENYGIITADALTVSDADSYAYVSLLTNPSAISEAEAMARAAGIDGGAQGSKVLDNFGSIVIDANAGARPYALSDSGTMNTYADGYGLAESEAFGITSGNFSNKVTNHNDGSISVIAQAGTYDTLGNTGFARCDEVVTISAGHYESWEWTPLSAKALGIALFDGDDIVVNDGSIIVDANAQGQVYAYAENSSAVNRNPDSDAQSVVLGQAQGIAAGAGSNEVTNNGLLTVKASSYAAPKAYSYSNWVSSSTDVYGDSNAVAVGIEADGKITNSNSGILDVTAKAESFANTTTNSESANATAILNATATGFSTFTDTSLTELQQITNNGIATIRAIAGEDDDIYCAYVNSDLTSGSTVSDANGILTVDAAGIRVGDGLKEITNNSTLNVLGQGDRLLANAIATSTYARSTTNSYGEGIAIATGILADSGENHIYNFGTMDVNSIIDVYARGFSDSGWQSTYTTYATAESRAETIAQGISVGSGDDEIINEGSLIITSTAKATSSARSDEYATSTATSEAFAVGIDGGAGSNRIVNENSGTLDVTARAMVATHAYGDYRTWNPETTTEAIGITVGDGGSYIRNSGTINVQALDYDNSSYHNVKVVGIRGGSGNDYIVNEGDIDTYWRLEYYPSGSDEGTGIAIDTGAGDDMVVLADGSNIGGSVYLGAGDDTLTVTGIPVFNRYSPIYPGGGVDTVVFDGTGSLAGYAYSLDFENMLKLGSGTYTIPYTLRVTESLEVREGILEVTDLQFSPTSRFRTVATLDGSYGQLKSIGFAALILDGTLAVERETGLYQQPRTYDIITSSILPIYGAFDEVQLPESGPLLEFSMEQNSDSVQISVTPKSFASAASNKTESSIGQYLDRITPQATGELYDILSKFQVLSAKELSTAYASLSPTMYDSATTTTFDIISDYTQTLVKRMHSLRSHIENTNSDLMYRQTEKNASWIDAFDHRIDEDAQEGFAGFDYKLTGAAVGVDRLLQEDILVGISYGQADADVDMDSDIGGSNIEGYFGSLYGSYFNEDTYLDTTLSYGRQCYDSIRGIDIGEIKDTTYSDHHGDVYSAYVEKGWNISLNKFSLQPFASLRYTFLDEESFDEIGTEGINLHIEDRQTDSLVSDIGLRFSYPFKKDTWLCIPEATVAWDHDFNIDDRRITAAFDGSPTMTFVTDSRDIDENGIILGAGLTFIDKDSVNISMRYTSELRSHSKSHAFTLGIRYEF